MHLGRVITSPRCTVGRVNPSSSAFYQSKGRVDGSLDEPMTGGEIKQRKAKNGVDDKYHRMDGNAIRRPRETGSRS